MSRAKKDIEFVIPPSFSSTSNRPGAKPLNQKITVSNNPFTNDLKKRVPSQQQLQQQQQQLKQQQEDQKGGVTKGWDFLATVFSASVSLKEGGSKVRSKEAPALLITTTGSSGFLDIPTIKTA